MSEHGKFLSEGGWGKETISKRKGLSAYPWGERGKKIVLQVTSSSFGGWRRPLRQITPLALIREFQTDQLRLNFWGWLKLQLG